MDYKKRVQDAMNKYYQKLEGETDPSPKRKNQKPEKLVEAEVLLWCKQNGFDVDVVDSKATFSLATRRYTGKTTSFGLSDIIGNTSEGLGVYIELKAKGRRVGSALDPKQRAFLIRKINTGAFAIMCDSSDYLNQAWNHFKTLTFEDRISFLINELPSHNQRQLKLEV